MKKKANPHVDSTLILSTSLPTTDDWSPNCIRDTVAIRVVNRDGWVKVLVRGDDDTCKWHKDNRTDFWYENDIVQCLLVDYGDENGVEYNRQSVAPKRSVSVSKPAPKPAPTQAEKDAVIYDQQYAFFAAPSIPENCICEILKSTCRYHG